jgi:hypothetical protein
MAYIGKTPTVGNFQKCDAISVVNGQAAYTLQVGGSNVSPESPNHVLVSLNGVLQAPTDSYTISGSTLTFASNLATGDVIDFIMLLGNVLDLGVPSDNTVSLAKLTATGTKDATTFLRGDNTFASPSSDYVLLADASSGTSVASISIDGYFSSTYNSYVVFFDSVEPASAGDLSFRFNVGGSANSSSNYIYQTQQVSTNSSSSGLGQSNSSHLADKVVIFGDRKVEASATSVGNGNIEIFNALSTTGYKYARGYHAYFNAANNNDKMTLYSDSCLKLTSALTGITIFHSAGNLKGNFYLYGRKS